MTLAAHNTTQVQYTVLPADLHQDRDAILALWMRNLPAPGSLANQQRKFAWYYLDNPAGPGRCWLLRATPGDRVVGTAGLGKRRIYAANSSFLVGLASDFAVDHDHRLLRPALMLQRAVTQSTADGLPMIYALPAKQSAGAIQRVGYQSLGNTKRYVKILRIGPYLNRLVSLPRPFTAALAAIANPILRFASSENWRRSRGYSVSEVSTFDARFDELWNTVSTAYPIIGQRTADFLRWRYTHCPLLAYHTLALFTQSRDRLLGYAVCHLGQNQHATIIDLLTNNSDDALIELLAATVSFARDKHAASLSLAILDSSRFEPSLLALGFHLRLPGHPLMVFPANATPLPATRLRNWYFTLGDEDYN